MADSVIQRQGETQERKTGAVIGTDRRTNTKSKKYNIQTSRKRQPERDRQEGGGEKQQRQTTVTKVKEKETVCDRKTKQESHSEIVCREIE